MPRHSHGTLCKVQIDFGKPHLVDKSNLDGKNDNLQNNWIDCKSKIPRTFCLRKNDEPQHDESSKKNEKGQEKELEEKNKNEPAGR